MTEILETQIDAFTKADAGDILQDIEVEIMDVELEERVFAFTWFVATPTSKLNQKFQKIDQNNSNINYVT